MAYSTICTSKCGSVAVRWVRKNDAPVVPWGWIATELIITAQIGLMIIDQSSGFTFLKFSSILKLGFVFILFSRETKLNSHLNFGVS